MISGIRVSAAGAQAQSVRHDIIANNLANVNTVGFRRQLAIIAASRSAEGAGPLVPDLAASPHETGRGVLQTTERPGDLALDGEGYFALSDGRQTFYSRAGSFDLDADGRLVTADHRYAVLGSGGQPVRLDRAAPFTVTDAGHIMQNGNEVGRLAVVTFRSPERLVRVGANLAAAPAEAGAPRPAQTAVRQGCLEQSSVEPVRELVAMLEASRAYEANVRLISEQDAALGRLINDAGRLA
jgi:flagellar basal-body rod protein FlgF